jgi:two-component system OmpR family sensor kinase
LRSPLSRLRAEIEITLRRPRQSGDYVTALRSCLDEVERLTLLVEELLLLARLDAGQERGPAEMTPLPQLADNIVRRMQPVAQERGIALTLQNELQRELAVDQGPLSLVLRNLLDNAIKFSAPGGHVTVRLLQDADGAWLTIADQGPGLDQSELPFVFDRFFRGTGSRAGEVDGFGLGLALSQTIMQAQGGRIEAANQPGGGAVFTIRLP